LWQIYLGNYWVNIVIHLVKIRYKLNHDFFFIAIIFKGVDLVVQRIKVKHELAVILCWLVLVAFMMVMNYAKQFNWGLDNTSITTKWVVRLDADERFTPELCAELEQQMTQHENDDVNGIILEARLFFMDKELKHGGSRKKKLMVFKNGIGRVENRKMDEHTVLSKGTAVEIKEPFLHYDFKDLTTYVKKLNWYATREMQDYMEGMFPKEGFDASNADIEKVRARKTKYYKAPMFWRCFGYFLYAYLIKGNCRNGKEGFIYSFLYHLYYMILVDAKIYEQLKYKREFEVTGDLK